jgi:hypothetical protein
MLRAQRNAERRNVEKSKNPPFANGAKGRPPTGGAT